jgi:transcriptional regulator with XRE-family HTH domain
LYIYDKIKKICKEKGLSVTYVEKKAELGNGLISKWNDSVPSVANLKKVASILEVTVDELIGDEE